MSPERQKPGEEREPQFANQRDKDLYDLCQAGWGRQSAGEVDSPYGAFWSITNEPVDRESLEDVLEKLVRPNVMGHFMVIENELHFVTVMRYPHQSSLDAAFQTRAQEYEAWRELEGRHG